MVALTAMIDFCRIENAGILAGEALVLRPDLFWVWNASYWPILSHTARPAFSG